MVARLIFIWGNIDNHCTTSFPSGAFRFLLKLQRIIILSVEGQLRLFFAECPSPFISLIGIAVLAVSIQAETTIEPVTSLAKGVHSLSNWHARFQSRKLLKN